MKSSNSKPILDWECFNVKLAHKNYLSIKKMMSHTLKRVFYVDDEKEKGWSIPIHVKPRDLYDMGEEDEKMMVSDEAYP
ncbi:hypothetical protein SESBI_43763 [Sesbania bispinosa]|nr:hypothetical protein SESBI_43763 [Sesbania bispinosa]